MTTTLPGVIHHPTIAMLRVELDALEAYGIPTDAPLRIAHLANAPGTFVIYRLDTPTPNGADA
jgi:hypothetical protein